MAQEFRLDINQVNPQALNLFYSHIVRQCALATEDKDIMKEYEQYKQERKRRNVKNKKG